MQSDKIGLGKINEIVLNSIFHSIFDSNYRIKSNDFKNYNNGIGHGTDFKIWLGSLLLFEIEAKNWRDIGKPYGKEIVETEIIDRFHNSTAKHKILVISYDSLISKLGIDLLKRHNITVFSVDRLIGKKVFKSPLFYQIKAQLSTYLNGLRSVVVGRCVRLTEYVNSQYSDTLDSVTINTDTRKQRNIDKITKLLEKHKDG